MRTILLLWMLLIMTPAQSGAQNSSLFSEDLPEPEGQQPPSLATSSWTYRQLPPPQEIRIHDIISIRVDEKSQVNSEGEMQRRKNGLYDATLKDWIHLEGLKAIKLDKQEGGDQRAQGQLNQIYRSEAELETREALKFEIAAEVADIRPNGNLVLECIG